MSALTSWDGLLRDYYPQAGERIKQYVVDERRDAEWERQTCPWVDAPEHTDNCVDEGDDSAWDAEFGKPIGGRMLCSNVGRTRWSWLDHDSCYTCGDFQRATADRPDIAAWRAERDARPKPCTDRSKLSDEVAPDLTAMANPALRMLRK